MSGPSSPHVEGPPAHPCEAKAALSADHMRHSTTAVSAIPIDTRKVVAMTLSGRGCSRAARAGCGLNLRVRVGPFVARLNKCIRSAMQRRSRTIRSLLLDAHTFRDRCDLVGGQTGRGISGD